MKRAILALAIVACFLTVQSAELSERIHRDIAKLEAESMAESLAKLSDVNLFYWPGPPIEGYTVWKGGPIPLAAEAGQRDLEAIMSNRRFRKVFVELGKLSKDAASEIVHRELSAAITEHLTLYNRFVQDFRSSQLKAGVTNSQGRIINVPAFAIGNVPEGQVVIGGARLKVLSLVWTSGMLGLTGTSNEVTRVAQLALKQRAELYAEPALSAFFKAQLLTGASLYNRQIIGSGLLGVLGNPELQASAIKAAGIEWKERELVLYQAAVTEYDQPVHMGIVKPDYSQGSLTVKFTGPMDDTRFDILLKALHGKTGKERTGLTR